MASASLDIISDRSIILAMEDNGGLDGWVNVEDIARVLDLASRALSNRLSWMQRYGMVERNPDVRGEWGLLGVAHSGLDDVEVVTRAAGNGGVRFDMLRREVQYWQKRRKSLAR